MIEEHILEISKIFELHMIARTEKTDQHTQGFLEGKDACAALLEVFLDNTRMPSDDVNGYVNGQFGQILNCPRILPSDRVEELGEKLRSVAKLSIFGGNISVGLIIAAIVYETLEVPVHPEPVISGLSGTEIAAYWSVYAAFKVQTSGRDNDRAETVGQLLGKLDQITTSKFSEVFDEKIGDFQNKIDQQIGKAANNSAEEIAKTVTEKFALRTTTVIDNLASAANTMLENKKNELVETIINEDAMQLWNTKADRHTKLFRIGAILFGFLIAIPIIVLLWNFSSSAALVKDMIPSNAAVPWGSLLVFTVPILGYAWILRLVSRFTLHNLTLADDASQRSVMAKTFIRLVGQGDVNDDKDRAIMLNALFRPMPGVNEKDIQPPSIADFVSQKN